MTKNFEKISEKILPQKIKEIIWHSTTDIIIINCGKYFEVQRISFKHETIFKRDEKTQIKSITILDSKEAITVTLIDNTFTIININSGDVLFSSKTNIPLHKDDNYVIGKVNTEQIHTPMCIHKQNPFKQEHFIFNSFSKLDVSKVNYLNNANISLDTFYIWNTTTNTVELSQQLMTLISSINLKQQINKYNEIINIIPYTTNNTLLTVNKLNNNDYEFGMLNVDKIITHEHLLIVYQLDFALNIIEYINQILLIITRIIRRLGMILFDKYSSANEWDYIITSDNERAYQSKFNDELKKMFLFGTINQTVATFLKKDLFETKSIIKMDEEIHFNLKNVQDILIENVKPVLNKLGYFFNRVKCFDNELEENFKWINITFDSLVEGLLEVSFSYRNFLAWVNSFNNKDNNENFNENAKNYLSSILIDYQQCFNFICNKHYNMEQLLNKINDNDNENDNNTINNNNNNTSVQYNKECKSIINSNSNSLLQKYLKVNGIDLNKELNTVNNGVNTQHNNNNANSSSNSNNKSIKEYLSLLKKSINTIKDTMYIESSKKFVSIYSSFFILKNIQSPIIDLALTVNLTKDSIFTFTNNDLLKKVLYIIVFNSSSGFKFAKVNFTYENGVTIIDYKLTNQNELVLLVKSTSIENDLPTVKYSLILSELMNYNFVDLKCDNNNNNHNTFDLFNFDVCEDIKIDLFVDLDCGDNSFISIGERRLVAVVNNTTNKIVDITNI